MMKEAVFGKWLYYINDEGKPKSARSTRSTNTAMSS